MSCQHSRPIESFFVEMFQNLITNFTILSAIVAQSTPFNACKFVCSLFLSKYQKIKIDGAIANAC